MARIVKLVLIVILVAGVGVGAFIVGRHTAPTTSSSPPVCKAAELHATQSGSSGAAGTMERTFSLVNTGSTTCVLDGYPRLLLLDRSGGALPTQVVRGGGLAFEDVAPSTVVLGPKAASYFNVGYSDVMSPCSSATSVQITPPGGSAYLVVSVSPTMRVCDNGTLHVSAVFGSGEAAATKTTAAS